MNPIKIAVIGIGHLGFIHAKLLKNVDYAELSGFFELNDERAQYIVQELGIHRFESLQQAIDNSDAIIIASPTSVHFDIAYKVLEANKHCFIEKPITATYQEAVELIELAKKKGVIVQVGHVERFNPALLALQSYSIEPLFIEAHRLSQFKPRATDVSVIHDLMIHDIDIILWLAASKVKNVEANAVSVLTETADIANARISFENGCVANITASRISAQPMRKMRIFQKSAYLSLDFAKPSVDVYRLKEDKEDPDSSIPAMMLGQIDLGSISKSIVFEQPTIPQINAIAEEHIAFVKAIKGEIPVAVSAFDAAEALRIAELIVEKSTQ